MLHPCTLYMPLSPRNQTESSLKTTNSQNFKSTHTYNITPTTTLIFCVDICIYTNRLLYLSELCVCPGGRHCNFVPSTGIAVLSRKSRKQSRNEGRTWTWIPHHRLISELNSKVSAQDGRPWRECLCLVKWVVMSPRPWRQNRDLIAGASAFLHSLDFWMMNTDTCLGWLMKDGEDCKTIPIYGSPTNRIKLTPSQYRICIHSCPDYGLSFRIYELRFQG